jgi:hypothetical protein
MHENSISIYNEIENASYLEWGGMSSQSKDLTFDEYIEQLIYKSQHINHRSAFKHRKILAVGYTALILVGDSAVAGSYDVLRNNNVDYDFATDVVFMIEAVVHGLSIYYFLSLPGWVGEIFRTLHKNEVLAIDKVHINPKLEEYLRSKRPSLIALVLVLLMFTLVVVTAYFNEVFLWWEFNIVIFSAKVGMSIFGWYIGTHNFVTIISTILLINSVFNRNKLTVQAQHPDNGGGLGAVSKFALRLTTFVTVYGVLLAIWILLTIVKETFRTEYGLMTQAVIYLVIVPMVFYLPLHKPHKKMVEFRDNLIQATAEQYKTRHLAIHEGLKNGSLKDLRKELEYLQDLEKLQEQNRKYPIWTFDWHVRIRVLISSIFPWVLSIIGLLLG